MYFNCLYQFIKSDLKKYQQHIRGKPGKTCVEGMEFERHGYLQDKKQLM